MQIAFQAWEHDPPEIYVMDIDGGNFRRLTNNAVYDDYPDWSPDGDQIVFISINYLMSNPKIFVMNADGSQLLQLTEGDYYDIYPDWSPDGTHILFQSNRPPASSSQGIFIMDADGSNIMPVSASGDYNSELPRWSPDGSKIVFNSDMDLESGEIYIIDRDGSNLTRLTDDLFIDYSPIWLPRKKGVMVTEASVIIPNLASATEEMTAQQITSYARDAVVKISTDLGSGSGFIIGADGFILTNNHVVSDAEEITVYLEGDSDYEGTVLARDMVHDLALVKINESGLPTLEIGDLSGVDLGEQVIVMGYPMDKENVTVTSGLVSSIEYDDGSNVIWVQTDSAVNPGNSGGPMLDHYGRVIGVVSAKTINIAVEGVAYAVSANTINMYLPEIYPDYDFQE
jgi:dipeptidyl aminopeptidase/acylaminoacyl peptidase